MMSSYQISGENHETVSVVIRASFILISMRAIDERKRPRDSQTQHDSCKRQRMPAHLVKFHSHQLREMLVPPRGNRVCTLDDTDCGLENSCRSFSSGKSNDPSGGDGLI
jgi:hypothetical protein